MARTLNQLEAVAAWEEARATFRAVCAAAERHPGTFASRPRLAAAMTARINRRAMLASRILNPKFTPDSRWDNKGYWIGGESCR